MSARVYDADVYSFGRMPQHHWALTAGPWSESVGRDLEQDITVDVAVIGGGIVGLAHAWSAARRRLSVVLFDRNRRPQGASVRNFGMIWPIGQTPGEMHQRALHSRALWLELAQQAGFWVKTCGSLHLVYQDDELAVIEEFVAQASVEALDKGILGRLARRDVVPLDLPFLAEAQHRHSGQLSAVVGQAHRRPPAPGIHRARAPMAFCTS